MADHPADPGFKVVDRRVGVEPTAEAAAEPDQAAPPAAGGEYAAIDFGTFVLSLASSAAMQLGDMAHPETGQVEKNLPAAKQTIDLIAMLQQKTRGNLTPEEERFLEALLYDLRLRFVESSKG